MQAILNKTETVFLNFLYNRYKVSMVLVQSTTIGDTYMGQVRCKDGAIRVLKFVKGVKQGKDIFTVYDINKRVIYQCFTLNTEGRTKNFLDKLVIGNEVCV